MGKNSSFLVKRNFLELSSEPGNLMNKNSFKYSGLANAEVVDIQDDETGITFSKKNKKNANQPARNFVKQQLKKISARSQKRSRRRPKGATTARTSRSLPLHGGTKSGKANRLRPARINHTFLS